MKNIKNTGYSDFIGETLEEVSGIARASFGKVTGIIKKEDYNQVLTKTDLEIGERIIKNILARFATYNIIDEEAGVIDKKSDYTWVIDPIDGTSNYAYGVPLYGIMMGLLEKDKPICGGVALPSFSEIYLAEKNKGAYCNGEKLSVTVDDNLNHALVAYGIDGYRTNPELTRKEGRLLSEIILNIRNLRSSNSAFDWMMVAQGKYGAFLSLAGKIWDNVAPQIIIEEAGGKYTDFFGKKIDYTEPLKKAKDGFTFLAAAPGLQAKILDIVKRKFKR